MRTQTFMCSPSSGRTLRDEWWGVEQDRLRQKESDAFDVMWEAERVRLHQVKQEEQLETWRTDRASQRQAKQDEYGPMEFWMMDEPSGRAVAKTPSPPTIGNPWASRGVVSPAPELARVLKSPLPMLMIVCVKCRTDLRSRTRFQCMDCQEKEEVLLCVKCEELNEKCISSGLPPIHDKNHVLAKLRVGQTLKK